MLKVGLIILALIGLVGTTTHYAFANNMGGPAMGPADSGGGGGSMTYSPILTPSGNYGGAQTTDSGSAGPSDTTTGTDTGGYTAFYHHQHHMWGSNFWREKRGECPACGEAVPYEHWMDSHGVWHQHHHAWEPNARAVIHGVMPGSDVVRELP